MRFVPCLVLSLLGAVGSDVAAAQEPVELASSKVLGRWNLVLSEEEQHQVDALALAFRDPIPTDEELDAADLSEDASMVTTLVVGLRRIDPNDPALDQYRQDMLALRDASLTITDDRMSLSIGPDTQVLTYDVLDARETRMRVRTTDAAGVEQTTVLRLKDEDQTLSVVEETRDGARLLFHR